MKKQEDFNNFSWKLGANKRKADDKNKEKERLAMLKKYDTDIKREREET